MTTLPDYRWIIIQTRDSTGDWPYPVAYIDRKEFFGLIASLQRVALAIEPIVKEMKRSAPSPAYMWGEIFAMPTACGVISSDVEEKDDIYDMATINAITQETLETRLADWLTTASSSVRIGVDHNGDLTVYVDSFGTESWAEIDWVDVMRWYETGEEV